MINSQSGIDQLLSQVVTVTDQNQRLKQIMRISPRKFSDRKNSSPKTGSSPIKAIYRLNSNPKKSQSVSSQSPRKDEKEERAVQEYNSAVNINQHLREQFFCLLMDAPEYMSSRSLGVDPGDRDAIITQASVCLKQIEKNKVTIKKYQRVAVELTKSASIIAQIRQINSKIDKIYYDSILREDRTDN